MRYVPGIGSFDDQNNWKLQTEMIFAEFQTFLNRKLLATFSQSKRQSTVLYS